MSLKLSPCFPLCPFLPAISAVLQILFAYSTRLTLILFIDEALTHPVHLLSSVELQEVSGKDLLAAAGSKNDYFAEKPLENDSGDSDPDVVLVDFEENDPENPLNWLPTQKWLILFVIS